MPIDVAAGMGPLSDVATAGSYSPNETALSSPEQIYSPVAIYFQRDATGGNDPSGFETAKIDFGSYGLFGALHLGPTRDELDPYFSRTLGTSGNEFIQNCDFQAMMSDGSGSAGGDANIRKVNRAGISGIFATHFRGPMVMSGWGFDLGDRPVPNFGNNAFTVDSNLVNDRSTWKAGPIDFKWDAERKVWSMGHHMLCGVVSGTISPPEDPCNPTYFTIKVFRNNSSSVGNGGIFGVDAITNCDLQEEVVCTNRDPSLSEPNVPGRIFAVCARINYEWIPIWVGCPDPPAEDAPDPDCVC